MKVKKAVSGGSFPARAVADPGGEYGAATTALEAAMEHADRIGLPFYSMRALEVLFWAGCAIYTKKCSLCGDLFANVYSFRKLYLSKI